MTLLGEIDIPNLWEDAIRAYDPGMGPDLRLRRTWKEIFFALSSLARHAPNFKMIAFEEKKELLEKNVKMALEKVPVASGQWTVSEFINRLVDDEGNYLFHVKTSVTRKKTQNVPAPHGVAAAFDSTRFQDSGSVSHLIERVRTYALKWNGEDYYAPYCPILNASMVGKSRLISELPNHGVFIFTVCLRPETDPEYRPPRSGPVADWATKDAKDPILFTQQTCFFLECVLDLFKDWLSLRSETEQTDLVSAAKAWEKYQKDNQKKIWDTVNAKIETATRTISNAEGLANTIEVIISNSQSRMESVLKKIHDLLAQWVSDYVFSESKRTLFLFVVDEAKQLKLDEGAMNGFTLFRRALRAFPIASEEVPLLFCLLTDTSSKVSNFSPAAEVSNSARILKGPHLLFPPFTVVNSIDVWADRARFTQVQQGAGVKTILHQIRNSCVDPDLQSDELDAGPADPLIALQGTLTVEILETYEYMATYGRAGLYAQLIGMKLDPLNQAGPSKLHQLLKVKLLRRLQSSHCVTRDDEDAKSFNSSDKVDIQVSQQEVIGVLGAVSAISVSACSVLATEVSAGHIRLILAISKLGNYVFTFEVSEPVLALAAHELICYMGWPTVLSKLAATQFNGATQLGIRGEYAFGFLALMAYQICMGFNTTSDFLTTIPIAIRSFPCLPLIEFLQRFLGETMRRVSAETEEAWIQMQTIFKYASVRPNQIVRVETAPSLEMVYENFLRGTLICCKKNQQGIDFVIPVNNPGFSRHTQALPSSFMVSNETLVANTHARLGACRVDLNPTRGRINLRDRLLNPRTLILEEDMTFILVQVKTGKSLSSIADKVEVLDQIDNLSLANGFQPNIVLLCELRNAESPEQERKEPISRNPQSICPLAVRGQKRQLNDRFAIFSRDLKPSDIWTDSNPGLTARMDEEFSRVLEPQRNLLHNKNIDRMDLALLPEMCRTQPPFDSCMRKRAFDRITH